MDRFVSRDDGGMAVTSFASLRAKRGNLCIAWSLAMVGATQAGRLAAASHHVEEL